jgi:hypothetical protein
MPMIPAVSAKAFAQGWTRNQDMGHPPRACRARGENSNAASVHAVHGSRFIVAMAAATKKIFLD